ncbi:MAG: hypothetical protein QM687_17275 [Ferruginibacter sp.]
MILLPYANQHFISLQTAIDMTSRYRSNSELILDSAYRGRAIFPLNETFHRDAIESLLAIEGCAAVRIYYGMDETEKVHAVLVPVNENNEDILPFSKTNTDPAIVEVGQRCPPSCPPQSELNT